MKYKNDRYGTSDKRWDNYCNRLIILIDNDGDDFPTEEDINKLVKYTEKAFRGTPYIDHAMNRAFKIRRDWGSKLRKRMKSQQGEQRPMEDKLNLSVEASESIKEVITKIAAMNKIAMADRVTIQLSPEEGIITFTGIEENNEG